MNFEDAVIRDFTNTKGTRYTKTQHGVGYDKGGFWFVLVKNDTHWVAGFRDINKGFEVKLKILPQPGTKLINALQAYRTAMDSYAAFVLNNEESLKKFEAIEVVSDQTLH